MPLKAADIEKSSYLRLLVMGPPKAGKTRTVVASSEKPVYVINCDDKNALRPATQATRDFEWDLVSGANVFQEMENAIKTAREGVKGGAYKTVVWDTISSYASAIEPILANATDTGKGPDGRRYWPEYEKRLRNVVERLFRLEAHVIVIAHFIELGGEVGENQLAKSGHGLVPLLGGKARATIPALFQDVVFFEKKRGGQRVFTCSVDGVFGPGCRNLDGVTEVDADVEGLWVKMGGKPWSKSTKASK